MKTEKEIRRVIHLTPKWIFPSYADCKVKQALINLEDLLPDSNIENFIRDCPRPPEWYYHFDLREFKENGDKGKWVFYPSRPQIRWCATAEISGYEMKTLSRREIKQLEIEEIENTLFVLIDLIQPAITYSGHKTKKELKQMYVEFNKVKEDGPPNEIPDYVQRAMKGLDFIEYG